MSSLIFHTELEQAVIATDTLAVSPGGRPFSLTSKAFHVPHLRMLIAGTGCGGFLDRWLCYLNSRMIIIDAIPKITRTQSLIQPQVGEEVRQAMDAQTDTFLEDHRRVGAGQEMDLGIILKQELLAIQRQARQRAHEQVQIVFRQVLNRWRVFSGGWN
jgi:hypothetical protein